MTKDVRVRLNGIKNTRTGSDGGANLEIYGDLFARRVMINPDTGESQPLDSRHLFHVASENAINISENSTYSFDRYEVLRIHDGEWLWIGGHLAEQDDFPNANDNLGFVDKKIRYARIGEEPNPSVEFTDNDQHVVAQFTVIVEGEF